MNSITNTFKTYRKQFQDLFPKLFPEIEERVREYKHKNDIETPTTLLTKTITFVVTEACNLACTYCYECHKNHAKRMSKETAMKAVDMILDDNKMNGYINSKETPSLILEFIGGEPLLEVEIMDFVCDYFRYKATELNHPWRNNYMISFTSNGVLYKKENVQKFLQKNRGRISATITIDGNKELHDACRIFHNGQGSYDTVIESIKLAQEQMGLKTTKVTFAPENIEYISKSVPHLFELGLTDINANCVYEDVWKKEHAQLFYKELIKLADYMLENKIHENGYCSIFDYTIGQPMSENENSNWCGGNGQMLAIGPDGNLYPCIRFMKYTFQNQERPEFLIGNVIEGTIDKEEDNEYLQCLSCITRKSQSTDECFNCPIASGCSWCTGYNYDKFGTPDKRATFICWQHKARVLANYYYWNKLYKELCIDKEFKLNLSDEEIKFIKGEE